MKIGRILGLVFFLVFFLYGGQNAFAMHFVGAPMTATLDCNGINVTNTSVVQMDRDNTGSGMEAYEIVGTDGAGNSIFGGTTSIPVGTTLSQPPALVPWMTPPQYNPLSFRIVSLAGNGLPAETLVSFSGTCQRLPTYSTAVPTLNEWGLIIFAAMAGLGSVYYLRRRRHV